MEDYPEYEGLIAQLNGTIVDADMACSAVLGYARSSLGEQSLAVLEHNEFQNMVGRFHQWLNDNVEALDQDPKNFDQWCELFLADLQQAKGRQRVRLCRASAPTGSAPRNGVPLKRYSFQRSPRLSSGGLCRFREGGSDVPAFLFWAAGKSQAALAWSGPGLGKHGGGPVSAR